MILNKATVASIPLDVFALAIAHHWLLGMGHDQKAK
jgi:hypothetical protein